MLAVVLPGGVSSVASTLASFLPAPILTSVNDALAGGNSSALLYAAFDGETNHVRISGSYLNLFLLADDDPHVPVVRVPPVLNKAILDSFTVDASLVASLGLNAVLDIGIEGEIGIGYEGTLNVGLLFVEMSVKSFEPAPPVKRTPWSRSNAP